MGLETRPPPEGHPATDAHYPAPIDVWPTPAVAPVAPKADDLESSKKAVDDAASVGGGLWLSYLFVLFYLGVAAGAVTHTDLFLEKAVKLPFLNIELPLLAFFFLAPILFLFVHAYALVHLVFLTDKAKRFDEAVRRQGASENGLRQGLPSNIFIQFLAGPPSVRAGAFGWLLRLIAWSTLAVAPILLLLLLQVQFLPYHSSFITRTQRIVVLADLALLWWLWREILGGREPVVESPWARRGWLVTALVLTACTALFSWGLATFPGEWQTESFAGWRPIHERDRSGNPIMVSVHDWLFESRINDTTRRRRWILSSTLVLTSLNIHEGLGIDDPDKAKWHDFVFRSRGRDLRGAIFDFANLTKVDFTGADLREASLNGAQLDLASFDDAHLEGASLDYVQLEGASLGCEPQHRPHCARLEGASLVGAKLQGASLSNAQLQGASLDEAQLQGAQLVGASLGGASLARAQLQGASLSNAQLQGASLEGASMDATDLSDARLWRASLPMPPSAVSAIRVSDAAETLLQPSADKVYQALLTITKSVPPGNLRNRALKRQSLDCASPDKTLASCDPAAVPPPEAIKRHKILEAARVDEAAYDAALAKVLKALVCSGEDDSVRIVRGKGFQARLSAAGDAASTLYNVLVFRADFCPVADSLTDADRGKLSVRWTRKGAEKSVQEMLQQMRSSK
jgi:uncharacterized protein YjbI with pentapeptide repeats